MPAKKLPSYVQRLGKEPPHKYRGWWLLAGKRKYGPVRKTPEKAHEDAMRARSGELLSVAGNFGDRTDEWLVDIEATRTPDTADYHRNVLKRIEKTIPRSVRLDRMRPGFLRELIRVLQDGELSDRTIHHCRTTLRAFFRWCIRRGYLREDITLRVEWPRPAETQPHVFTEVELASVLLRIQDTYTRALVTFIGYTGLRRAEVARLAVRDVDFPTGCLWVRGKSRNQSHPLSPEAATAARALLPAADGEFLIRGSTEKARRERIAELFRKQQRVLKEPRLHPHTLRHSVATILLRKGVSPATVQRFLRHSSYAMTQRYVHMVEQDLRAGIGVLQLVPKDVAPADHA